MPWTRCERRMIVVRAYTPPTVTTDSPPIAHRCMPLTVGQTLLVTATSTVWANGRVECDETRNGIFPLVHVVDVDAPSDWKSYCVRANCTLTEEEEIDRLSKEIISSLQKCWPVLQERYVSSGMSSVSISIKRMNALIRWRLHVVSGTLPVRQLHELRLKIATHLDELFADLGMPIVVRNRFGQPTHPQTQSVIAMHNRHAIGFRALPITPSSSHTPFCVHLTLHAVQQRTLNDLECTFALWDVECAQFVSEALTLLCKKHVAWDSPMHALFGGLNNKLVERGKILLVCRIARIGPIESRSSTIPSIMRQKLSSSALGAPLSPAHHSPRHGAAVDGLTDEHWPRQPFAIAVVDLAPMMRESVGGGANDVDELTDDRTTATTTPVHAIKSRVVPFFFNDNEALDVSIRKAAAQTSVNLHDTSATSLNQSSASGHSELGAVETSSTSSESLLVSMQLLSGATAADVHRAYPHCIHADCDEIPFLKSISNNVMATEKHSDAKLYVMLESAELAQCLADRNVEVAAYLVDDGGNVCPKSMATTGQSTVLQSSVRSVVHYHDSKPRWMQQITVMLPDELTSGHHLRFVLRHRSKDAHKDKKEKALALVYLRLRVDDGAVIADGLHELLVFQLDSASATALTKSGGGRAPYTGVRRGFHICCAELPCTRDELITLGIGAQPARGTVAMAMSNGGYVLCNKDILRVRTKLSSHLHTTNPDIYNILHHEAKRLHLHASLSSMAKRESALITHEMVAHMSSLLDVLFALMVRDDLETMAYDGVVSMLELVTEQRAFEAYRKVLDEYIQSTFKATNVYIRLLTQMTWRVRQLTRSAASTAENGGGLHVRNGSEIGDRSSTSSSGSAGGHMQCTLKVMPTLLKFVARAVELEKIEPSSSPCATSTELTAAVHDLLAAIARLMANHSSTLMPVQAHALKALPDALVQLTHLTTSAQLSTALHSIFDAFELHRLPDARLDCLGAIVHGPLFVRRETRRDLLEFVMEQATRTLTISSPQLTKCAVVFTSLFASVWHKTEEETTISEIATIDESAMIGRVCQRELMRTLIGELNKDVSDDGAILQARANRRTTIALDGESRFDTTKITNKKNATSHTYMTLLAAVWDRTSSSAFETYLADMPTFVDRHDFLLELLLLCNQLLVNPRYPIQWRHQRMIMNRSIRNMLTMCRAWLRRDATPAHYDERLVAAYFTTATHFVTQNILHVERMPPMEKDEILERYGELRNDVAKDMRSLWFCLNEGPKLSLGVSLLGHLLQTSLVGNGTFAECTVPVMIDIMLLEYNTLDERTQYAKANVAQFERELVDQLDTLIDEGWGDETFTQLFTDIVHAHTSHMVQPSSPERHALFMHVNAVCGAQNSTVTRLLRRLFEYRRLRQGEHDCHITRMSTLVNLADLYATIGQTHLQVKYTYKLHRLHLDMGNYAEAAFALLKHAQQLEWLGRPVEQWLIDSGISKDCSTEQMLKAHLMNEVVHLFEMGEQWEKALVVCADLQVSAAPLVRRIIRKLEKYHSTKSYDYIELATLLSRMALMYEKIATRTRLPNTYFLVKFIGNGFPAILANRHFVCRGAPGERLSDFNETLILDNLPNARLLTSLDADTPELRASDEQCLQILSVQPIVDDAASIVTDAALAVADLNIRAYHKYNDVQKFSFSRKSRKPATIDCLKGNEFGEMWLSKCILVTTYPLPGLLPHFPVTSQETIEREPLQVAVEMVTEANASLSEVIDELRSGHTIGVQPLQMKLNGMLNPAVQGGLDNYNCFFSDEFAEATADRPSVHATLGQLSGAIADQVVRLELGVYWHARECTPQDGPMHQLLTGKLTEMKAKVFARHGERASLLPAGASLQPQFVARSYTAQHGARSKTRASLGSQSALHTSSIFHDGELASNSNTPSPKFQRHTPSQSTIGLGFRSPLIALGTTANFMGGMQRQHSATNASKRMSNTSNTSAENKPVTVLNQEKPPTKLHRRRLTTGDRLTPSRPPRPTPTPKTPSRSSLSHHEPTAHEQRLSDTSSSTANGGGDANNNTANGSSSTRHGGASELDDNNGQSAMDKRRRFRKRITTSCSPSHLLHRISQNSSTTSITLQTSSPVAAVRSSTTLEPPLLTTRRAPPPVPVKPQSFV